MHGLVGLCGVGNIIYEVNIVANNFGIMHALSVEEKLDLLSEIKWLIADALIRHVILNL